MSGTQGKSKRLEAISIELTGDIANYYDVYYRVHAQDIGWMAWAKNGENAGTAGGGKRLESIQIVLVAKGAGNPGNVSGIESNYTSAYKDVLPDRYQFFDFQATYEKNGALTGMDVSAWQGDINWTAVKNAGVDFVIIRLARCSSTTQEMAFDTKFLQNYQGAKDAGLMVGAYYYCTRGDCDSVRADVNAICDYLDSNNISLDFPLAFDWEEYSKMAQWGIPDVNALNQLWYAYIDEMGKRGRDVMIYSSKWYLDNWWDVAGKTVWVANWVPQTNYKGEYYFWQVTSTGEVDGIKGVVDLDVYYPMGHKAYAGS
jgi:GH25 family lysozyme M1 (1,4-beta-N-acetylmuramidase)